MFDTTLSLALQALSDFSSVCNERPLAAFQMMAVAVSVIFWFVQLVNALVKRKKFPVHKAFVAQVLSGMFSGLLAFVLFLEASIVGDLLFGTYFHPPDATLLIVILGIFVGVIGNMLMLHVITRNAANGQL